MSPAPVQFDATAAEHNLVSALLADPGSFFIARAAGITSVDIKDEAANHVWAAAEKAVSAGDPPDAPSLIHHGAPQAAIVGIIGAGPSTLWLKQAIGEIHKASRRRRLCARLTQLQRLANDPDALDQAEALFSSPLSEATHAGLGGGVIAFDLCANPPATPAELISGVLYAGGTMMLSGPSKAHKTYTFLDLGVSVASGSEWLGFATKKAGVLYLNFELAEHSFARRLIAICEAKGIAAPRDFRSFNLRGRSATMALLAAELPRLIREHGVGLIILDPWYKLSATSGAEENSNDGQARILSEAERIVTANGAALVVGHHFAKGDASSKNSIDRAAGAGAMARWGDVVATLTEHQEPDAMTLEMHLRDFAPVSPIVLRWVHPIWQRDGSLNPAMLKKAGGRPEAFPAASLRDALRDGMSNKEWRDAIGWPDSTFRRKRDELIANGNVHCVSGTYSHVKAA